MAGEKEFQDRKASAIFDGMDKDGSGAISVAEAHQYIRETLSDDTVTEKQVKNWVKYLDQNANSELELPELQADVVHAGNEAAPKKAAQWSFAQSDTDKDGKESKEEAKKLAEDIGEEWGEDDIAQFDAADTDGDGLLTSEELESWFGKQKGKNEGEDILADKKEPGDAGKASADILKAVYSAAGEKKSRLLLSPQMKILQRRITGDLAPRVASPPSSLALASSWAGSSAIGLLVVPLLVAAFGCRRRFRVSSPALDDVALIDDAEE